MAGAFLTLGPLGTLGPSTQTLPRAYSYGRCQLTANARVGTALKVQAGARVSDGKWLWNTLKALWPSFTSMCLL